MLSPTYDASWNHKVNSYQLALKSTTAHWQPLEFGSQGSATVSTATISESCVFPSLL